MISDEALLKVSFASCLATLLRPSELISIVPFFHYAVQWSCRAAVVRRPLPGPGNPE